MNIIEQEDLVKGLPDQVLIQQAQMPTGEIPQFLVVSEIQRREKMRKAFAERVPEETVTEQVISQGIAAMNPNPDPLMATAMGAQPPMGQPPMMPPQQDPMMGQQMPPPVQMNMGGELELGLGSLTTPDSEDLIQQLMQLNLSEEEIEEIIRQGTNPAFANNALIKDAASFDPSKQTPSDLDMIKQMVFASNSGAENKTDDVFSQVLDFAEQAGGMYSEKFKSQIDDAVGDRTVKRDDAGDVIFDPATQKYFDQRKNLADSLFATPSYGEMKEDAEGNTVFTGLRKQIMDLATRRQSQAGERAEAIASEFKDYAEAEREEARQNMGATALMQLGAGIASGRSDLGLGDASKAVQQIRSDLKSDLRTARRQSLLDQRNEERLGIAAMEASEDRNLGLSIKDVENKYNNSVKRAEFELGTSKEIANEVNRLIGDQLASEKIALEAMLAVEKLAAQLTTAGVSARRESALTSRAIINGLTSVLEEAISKHAPALDAQIFSDIVDGTLAKMIPILGMYAGDSMDPEELARIIKGQVGAGSGSAIPFSQVQTRTGQASWEEPD